MKIIFIILFVVLSSCSLFTGFKKDTFLFTENNREQSISLRVPTGYSRVQTQLDSAGNRQQVYYYNNGSILYFTQANATVNSRIDTAVNKPALHPAGGWLYKGFDKNARYWKEYFNDSLWFGYKNVPYGLERAFDSSINYAGYRKLN